MLAWLYYTLCKSWTSLNWPWKNFYPIRNQHHDSVASCSMNLRRLPVGSKVIKQEIIGQMLCLFWHSTFWMICSWVQPMLQCIIMHTMSIFETKLLHLLKSCLFRYLFIEAAKEDVRIPECPFKNSKLKE